MPTMLEEIVIAVLSCFFTVCMQLTSLENEERHTFFLLQVQIPKRLIISSHLAAV